MNYLCSFWFVHIRKEFNFRLAHSHWPLGIREYEVVQQKRKFACVLYIVSFIYNEWHISIEFHKIIHRWIWCLEACSRPCIYKVIQVKSVIHKWINRCVRYCWFFIPALIVNRIHCLVSFSIFTRKLIIFALINKKIHIFPLQVSISIFLEWLIIESVVEDGPLEPVTVCWKKNEMINVDKLEKFALKTSGLMKNLRLFSSLNPINPLLTIKKNIIICKHRIANYGHWLALICTTKNQL